MADLTVVSWLWGTKYTRDYVDKLQRGILRHLKQTHRFLCIMPDPADPLLRERGCFVRLRMFDPAWQAHFGIAGRLVCIDLDVVVTGALDPLFDRPETFLILQGANSSNPCPYNGSLMMLRTGAHADVWRDFSIANAYRTRYHEFPDDQGWLWHKLPRAAGWLAGTSSGVWSFRKRGWPRGDELPAGARLVCFPGNHDPDGFRGIAWIQQHWR